MSSESISRTVTLKNPQGMHLRPADMFVKLAIQFKSDIRLSKQGQSVDGKSILDIVTLQAEEGALLEIEATGADAGPAVDALAELVEQGFPEENTTPG